MRRLVLTVVSTALVASGCGLLADPSVTSDEEVYDAVLAVQDGATARLTAALEIDERELRRVLRGDAEARALFRDVVEDSALEDPDALLDELEEVQALLGDHALLLAGAADRSGRLAAEYRGEVWADVRLRQVPLDDEDPTAGLSLDVQAQVDWDRAGQALQRPELPDDVATATDEVRAFLDGSSGSGGPDLSIVGDLAVGFLAGDLVAISGDLTPDLLRPFGLSPDMLSGGGLSAPEAGLLGQLPFDVDPRELAETALAFGDYRRDGDLTLVDVSVEVRAAAEYALDVVAEDPAALGMTTEDVQEGRDALEDLPERLQDVAVLRFDDTGTLRGVRVDLLDVALQVARAVDDQDDEDLVTFERVAGELDDTGLFLDLALDDVGTLDTVLAEDPAVTVGVRELLDLASTFFGEVGGSMFDSERQLEQVGGIVGGDDVPVEDRVAAGSGVFGTGTGGAGLQPQDLRVGDCIAEVTPGTDDVAPEEAVVPCDRPHAGEVIALVTADADRLEDADLAGSVYDRCEDAFVDYVGAQLIDTDLFIELLLPSPGRFEQGAREVACTVTTFTSPLTGSVADTGR